MDRRHRRNRFSALQRAEIAEISIQKGDNRMIKCFSALQRAEIAEILPASSRSDVGAAFQCSSTSRNC